MPKSVSEKDLAECLEKLRAVRAWVLETGKSPWVFRQAILIVEEIDRAVALAHGVDFMGLAQFDRVARGDAQRWTHEALGG